VAAFDHGNWQWRAYECRVIGSLIRSPELCDGGDNELLPVAARTSLAAAAISSISDDSGSRASRSRFW